MRARMTASLVLAWVVASALPWEAVIASSSEAGPVVPCRSSETDDDDACPPGCECLCCPSHTSVDLPRGVTGVAATAVMAGRPPVGTLVSSGVTSRVFRPPRDA